PSALPSTLSLHDALPISADTAPAGRLVVVIGALPRAADAAAAADILFVVGACPAAADTAAATHVFVVVGAARARLAPLIPDERRDRKSTRLNSSHVKISY